MQDLLTVCINKIKGERTAKQMFGLVMLVLSLIVVMLVYWQLKLTGVALANEYYCGMEEHIHTDECYEDVLVCELEEGEITGHVHTDECYQSEMVLVCELEENEEHTHDESCYEEQMVLICAEEEGEPHVHTEECYENQLTCGLEEHTHTVECMIDETADLEDSEIWEATLPELTGDWRSDVVAIAESQLGYTESTANYAIADDGETHKGYTRYGEWAGNPYGDWDGMFASFCLSYAGISRDVFPESTGAYGWAAELRELGLFAEASEYTPEAGDLIFFDKDADERIDHVGIVQSTDEINLTVIEGNVDDAVSETYYLTDDTAIIGYGVIPEQTADEETDSDDDETDSDDEDTDSDEEDSEDETDEDEDEVTLDESDETVEETESEIEDIEVDESDDEDLSTLIYEGDDYTIAVTYGEDATLPEGTELSASEYAQDSENYLARYEEAAELYGWEEDDEYNGFRLFDIGLYCDGAEVEPAAAVTVTLTYTGETSADSSVTVTHFGDTETETLDATLTGGDDSQSVTFTVDGFSEFGITLMSLTASAEETIFYTELTTDIMKTLQVEIVDNITSNGKLEARLYYLNDSSERVYVVDDDNSYYAGTDGTFTVDDVEYTVTYTWYRSKEPYLTDSEGYRESAPEKGDKKISNKKTSTTDTATSTITNYNYLLSTSSSFGATASYNYCSVINGSNIYLFYYYYVGVKITFKSGSSTTTLMSCESADEDTVYATLEDEDNTLGSVASYVKITDNNGTLTATLYDSNGTEVDPDDYSYGITYTYTWYKSRTYEASDGTTTINASDAPYANTIADTNDYAAVSGKSGVGLNYATLTLSNDDSFYFYYLQVTLNYVVYDSEAEKDVTYNANAKGYQDWAYAGLVVDSTSTDAYTAVIVDDLAASGTFKAVLYENSTGDVVNGSYTYIWYKSDDEYEITKTYTTTAAANSSIYSDQNVPSSISYSEVTDTMQNGIFTDDGDAVYVAKNFGALHYYKVSMTAPDGNTYESADKFVQYSDEIENGGFEIGITSSYSQINELYVAYWHTTNEEYSDSYGVYRGSRPIEVGKYGVGNALSSTTYALAYTKAGNAAQDYFVEVNATTASTLYQSVITAPSTTYYWSFYHQNRTYTTSTESQYIKDTETIDDDKTLVTYKTTGTDSMYVLIMSDEDAELLLAEADKNSIYDKQQDVIDAAAAYIMEKGTQDNTNGSVDESDGDDTISCSYTGSFPVTGGSVDITLWQVTTTKTVTRVYLYDTIDSNEFSSSYYTDASSLSSIYSTDAGWAPITATVNSVTTTVGYYTVTDWVKYTGNYTVPKGQYLTRFFFAAAYAQGGNAAGNFIDGVSLTYAIDYTIEYWLWNYDKCEYEKQDYEEGSTTPYTTVTAGKTSNYSKYGFIGSVTSYESGGSNPENFDDSATINLYVDAYNYVLSLYYGGPGVIVDKVISGVSTTALKALNTTVEFTITNTDTSVTLPTTTLGVTIKGAASGESSEELDDEGTYTIAESDCSSLFEGKYVWVGVDVTGATYNDSSGEYEFEITTEDPLPTVTFTNNYLPVVTLKKVDSTDSTVLSGVKFVMYKVDDTTQENSYYSSYNETTHEIEWSSSSVEHTTDSGLISFEALPDGTYYLEETATIDGYNTLAGTLSFTVSGGTITEVSGDGISTDSTDTYGLTLIVENTPGMVLPNTGTAVTTGTYMFAGGIIVLSAALWILHIRRRRKCE